MNIKGSEPAWFWRFHSVFKQRLKGNFSGRVKELRGKVKREGRRDGWMDRSGITSIMNCQQRERRNGFGEKDCEFSVVMFTLRCLRTPGSEDRLCRFWMWGPRNGLDDSPGFFLP